MVQFLREFGQNYYSSVFFRWYCLRHCPLYDFSKISLWPLEDFLIGDKQPFFLCHLYAFNIQIVEDTFARRVSGLYVFPQAQSHQIKARRLKEGLYDQESQILVMFERNQNDYREVSSCYTPLFTHIITDKNLALLV